MSCFLELNGCKRCGPEVCKFVAALCHQFCPKLYASPEAPLTRLKHTFYDCPWTQVTPPGAEPSSALFNEVLFATLADQILNNIIDARDSGKQHSMPLVLVLTYLHRHAAPLKTFLDGTFQDMHVKALIAPFDDTCIKVLVVDSARGMTASFCPCYSRGAACWQK